MDLIPIALRQNLREFCSGIPLRQIDDMFLSCGIGRRKVSEDTLSRISGERRTRVEEYYASLDWANPANAQKFLDVVSYALVQEYVPQDYKDRLYKLYSNGRFQIEGNTITLADHHIPSVASTPSDVGLPEIPANVEQRISEITRRDILDKLCTLTIEGRLSLIDFLKLTWPDLDSMPSPVSYDTLRADIVRHTINFPDWDNDFLLYRVLELDKCSDELLTTFLAACIHPLVRPDKQEVAELLSFFNESLRPDGYVLKVAALQSGRAIYKAVTLEATDEDYIVPEAIKVIERLARNFDKVVRRLSLRHDNRPPFLIGDEYDVQDLFYALLTPFFEDIRPEEYAPSHGGGHGRIDFLIRSEQIVIEIKKTRPSLKVTELRNQLIIDKEIYRPHPHCRTIIAFVYDPDGYIPNPVGFERDLSNMSDDIRMKVIVAPR